MGHVGRALDTHEWVVPGLPYIIVYQVRENEELVSVDAVFHDAQDQEKRWRAPCCCFDGARGTVPGDNGYLSPDSRGLASISDGAHARCRKRASANIRCDHERCKDLQGQLLLRRCAV